jgi:hypothetical protein
MAWEREDVQALRMIGPQRPGIFCFVPPKAMGWVEWWLRCGDRSEVGFVAAAAGKRMPSSVPSCLMDQEATRSPASSD